MVTARIHAAAEGTAFKAETDAANAYALAIAGANVTAAALAQSAVTGYVNDVTKVVSDRIDQLADEAHQAVGAAACDLLAQVNAWSESQATRYAAMTAGVTAARVAVWRACADIDIDAEKTKALAEITAWGAKLVAEPAGEVLIAAARLQFATDTAPLYVAYATQVAAAIDAYAASLGAAGVTYATDAMEAVKTYVVTLAGLDAGLAKATQAADGVLMIGMAQATGGVLGQIASAGVQLAGDIAKVNQEHTKTVASAQQSFANSVADIQCDLTKDIAKINYAGALAVNAANADFERAKVQGARGYEAAVIGYSGVYEPKRTALAAKIVTDAADERADGMVKNATNAKAQGIADTEAYWDKIIAEKEEQARTKTGTGAWSLQLTVDGGFTAYNRPQSAVGGFFNTAYEWFGGQKGDWGDQARSGFKTVGA